MKEPGSGTLSPAVTQDPNRCATASSVRLAIVTQKVIRGDGQGRVNFEIACAAARLGWRVTLLTSAVEPELRDLPNVNWVRIPWTTRYSSLVAEFRFAWQSAQWLRHRRTDFDVLHVNGFNTLVAGDVSAAHFVHGAWIKSPVHIARIRKEEVYEDMYIDSEVIAMAFGRPRLAER